MNELTFTRGDIVVYKENDAEKYGVNIQNWAGNKYSPTIIIAEIELISMSQDAFPHVILKEYPDENVKMVVSLGKVKTIDKEERVLSILSPLPNDKMKELDLLLEKSFQFEGNEQAQVVYVNLGRDVVGSEQGGERPAIILKNFLDNNKKHYLVAVMTSKMSKRNIPTHVLYEQGEGGIAKKSIGLFEQLKYVKEEDVINFYQHTPTKKLPNIKKAFDISVGINKFVKSGA